MTAVAAGSTANERSRHAELRVDVRGLGVDYGDTTALRAIDLRLRAGETVAVLGPSGSGKTTLLYAIAGFLPLVAGTISLDGTLVASTERSLPPERRPVAMVFQHYGLWPHLDALETVAYPLRRSGMDARTARAEARALLEQLGIGHLAARRPEALSGGEQQRVGLARALARRPGVYLLDEPSAHLDTASKSESRSELVARMGADGAAAIHATHDVEEALAVAHRVVLLRDGRVVQDAEPERVYAEPVDAWAARLTGPAAFVDGALAVDGTTGATLVVGDARVPVGLGTGSDEPGGHGRFLVRPDWVAFDGPLSAVVQEVAFHGTHTDYVLATAAGALRLRTAGPPAHRPGELASCRIERLWRLGDAQ